MAQNNKNNFDVAMKLAFAEYDRAEMNELEKQLERNKGPVPKVSLINKIRMKLALETPPGRLALYKFATVCAALIVLIVGAGGIWAVIDAESPISPKLTKGYNAPTGAVPSSHEINAAGQPEFEFPKYESTD